MPGDNNGLGDANSAHTARLTQYIGRYSRATSKPGVSAPSP